MEFWVVYHVASGEVRYRGSGPVGASIVNAQQLPAGLSLVLVPASALSGTDVDLAIVRLSLAERIDTEAEQVRLRFVTGGAGQAMTYARKEAEARAWTIDSSVPTPFLDAEATATGQPLSAVAAEVVARADAWVQIGSAIEGTRMGAKAAMEQADTLAGIVAAAAVDWSAFNG